MMKIGLLINPWAGIGGSVALKGSDGAQTRAHAISLGAVPKSTDKTLLALSTFLQSANGAQRCGWLAGFGSMGETLLKQVGVQPIAVAPRPVNAQTEACDTHTTAQWFIEQGVDLIVFSGGDGTARDICQVVGQSIPVIGIPAGVKIHSAVFAVTPHAAGEVLAGLVDGRITQLHSEEVRDIDEAAFRDNKVRSKYFGDMNVPVAGEFMQHVKVGGVESDELVFSDIAEWLEEIMQPDECYFVGSGKTTATIMDHLNLTNTLLGVDAVFNGEVIKADCTETDLLTLQEKYKCRALISIIGGQGHILGRGNAQFSAQVIRQFSKDDIWLLGSKNKLKTLAGRPLLVDTANPELDAQLQGLMPIIVGYNDTLIYPVAAL